MIKISYTFFILIIFLSFNINATTIAVVDIEKLINNFEKYILILRKIENSQEIIAKKIRLEEEKIEKLYIEIEDSKILLEEEEINKLINNYNNELSNFNFLVEEFNTHYQNEIIRIRKVILDQIIVLLEIYSKNNNIELVLDSNNYLIASNTIDITAYIAKELKNIDIKLDYKDFEKN